MESQVCNILILEKANTLNCDIKQTLVDSKASHSKQSQLQQLAKDTV